MTEQKFTPGPWEVRKSESKQAYNVVGTKLGGKWKIARCPANVYNMPDLDERGMIEAKANALLMSKSPELLESLEHCLQILEEVAAPDYLQETVGNMLMNYRNLINQATKL